MKSKTKWNLFNRDRFTIVRYTSIVDSKAYNHNYFIMLANPELDSVRFIEMCKN